MSEVLDIGGEKYKTKIKKQTIHRTTEGWSKLYFYRDRKRIEIEKDNIKTDKEITSELDYNKKTFYKISIMSKEDPYFDYYFKLKDNAPSTIIKKSKRRIHIKHITNQNMNEDKNGNIIIYWD